MPISFASGGSHYDVTPLENLFIENYMAEATGEFVKVYIYGLMFCYRPEEQPQEYSDIARDLHMNEETVRAAFAYWEKLQLLTVLSHKPLSLEYVNLKHKFISGTKAQDLKDDRAFRELSEQVQAIFTGERVVSTAEYKRVFEWYETLRFEQAAIAPLIEYCIARKGRKVSFNYIDTVMMDLAQKGVTTAEDVEKWILTQEAVNSGAARVLSRWSLRRAPTVDEMMLYRKWTEDWGFTEDAVIAACKEMTATDKPNFKYLDAVLESLHAEGFTSAREIEAGLEKRRKTKEVCADITKALGMRASVSNATQLIEIYDRFISLGFTDSAIQMAARMLCLEGRHTLADLQALLNKWYEEGTVSDSKLEYTKEKQGEIDREVKNWLDLWGQRRAPTPGERAAYVRFIDEWGMPADLVLFAAERAALADKPLSLMGKLLISWREKGIRDRRLAGEEQEKNAAGRGREDFSDRGFANQHTYTQEQFEGMKTQVFDLKDL